MQPLAAPRPSFLDVLVQDAAQQQESFPLIDTIIDATEAAKPKKRKLVLCGECMQQNCIYSRWVDA